MKESIMTTVHEISTKNTKNEILEAYEQVLNQLTELKKANKQHIKQEQEKKKTIETASQNTTDDIIQQLAGLKLNLIKSLEDIESQLLNEYKRLNTLQQAIALQTKDLEEIHEIKVETETLSALLQTQKQKREIFDREMMERRETFEQEMSQKRSLWKKEQEEAEALRKEQEILQKKSRQREEEEYFYKRDLERQKESDLYETQKKLLEKELSDKKAHLEKDFAERESMIIGKEQEYQTLKNQVENMPIALKQAIEETEQSVTEKVKFKYEYEAKLTQKEVEGERKLHEQMILALQTKIEQQEKQLKELNEKTSHAGIQVQEIAVKAIEGASRQRFYSSAYAEKTGEILNA